MAEAGQLMQELVAINALILEILSRRAVRGEWDGKAYTLHNLKDLYAIRDRIEWLLIGLEGRQVRTIVPRG